MFRVEKIWGKERGDTKTLVELRSVSVYDQSVELVQEKGRRSLTCSILGYWCNWKSVNKNMIGFSNQLGSPSVKLFFKTFFPPYLAGLKCRTNIFLYSDLWPLYSTNILTMFEPQFPPKLSCNFYLLSLDVLASFYSLV